MDKSISVGEHAKHRRGVSFFKHEARLRLFEKNNLLKLIFAFFTVGIFGAFAFYLFDLCSFLNQTGLFRMSKESVALLVYSLQFMIGICGSYTVFAMLYGFWTMCISVCQTGDGEIGSLFYAFESQRRMRRCLCGYLITLISAVPGTVLFKLSLHITLGGVVFKYTAAIFAALVGIAIFLIPMFFMLPYPLGGGKTVGERLKSAYMTVKRHIFSLFVLTLSFIPLIIISVLSFGILFIIYTVPYISLSYASVVAYAKDVEKYGANGGQNGE